MRAIDPSAVIHRILGLRRAELHAGPEAREEIAAARELLESLIGPTVRPAAVARLLGLSKSGLTRWLDNGEITSVLTRDGRREVPVAELVDLLEEVEAARDAGHARPVSGVLRSRRREAESIDVNRLLARRGRTHRLPELQSLAYHRLVADRLDERGLADARRRLKRLRVRQKIDPRWADEWERVLNAPLDKVARAIGADTPRARELRQTSPFAGFLTEHERRHIARSVKERA